MPELPEVEVVRRGLASWVRGRTITGVEVLDARSVRRHAAGPEDLAGNLEGALVTDVVRRGKFLWLPLVEASAVTGPGNNDGVPHLALMAHLGMSGQLLMEDSSLPDEKHLKVRFSLSRAADAAGDPMPSELRFVDQRIFGGVFLTDLVPHPTALPAACPKPRCRWWRRRRRTLPGTRWIRRSPLKTSTAACGPGGPGSNVPCWTRAWFPVWETFTRTSRCGRPGCILPGLPTLCAGPTRCG